MLASPAAFTVWQTTFPGTGTYEELDHKKASDQGSLPVLDILSNALSTPSIWTLVATCSLTFFLSAFFCACFIAFCIFSAASALFFSNFNCFQSRYRGGRQIRKANLSISNRTAVTERTSALLIFCLAFAIFFLCQSSISASFLFSLYGLVTLVLSD